MTWNLKTRLLHWGLASCVGLNLLNEGDDFKTLHNIVGYVAIGIILIRIFYGFFSSGTDSKESQFRHWPLQANALVKFVRHEMKRIPIIYSGHNPLACWVYISIWLTVLGLGVTGFMLVQIETWWGDENLELIHNVFGKALIGLLVLHFIGIAKDAHSNRRHTWMGMITGRRPEPKNFNT